eukprot:CAMPEP_0170452086 /NCGR_PEP_ID=MMETSP0123-20130129/1109_1 /TAXON_ID=182087 /ORGANISM="Favella ehrenbergii, Strain Fehren 1" /LENGTH=59 /DNA_ID=CAMNT_0010713989 /DNA_START=712 /DNA_END=891 /DNA_ORIENTATION=-
MTLDRVEAVEHQQVLGVLIEAELCLAIFLIVPIEADALLVEIEPVCHREKFEQLAVVAI